MLCVSLSNDLFWEFVLDLFRANFQVVAKTLQQQFRFNLTESCLQSFLLLSGVHETQMLTPKPPHCPVPLQSSHWAASAAWWMWPTSPDCRRCDWTGTRSAARTCRQSRPSACAWPPPLRSERKKKRPFPRFIACTRARLTCKSHRSHHTVSVAWGCLSDWGLAF